MLFRSILAERIPEAGEFRVALPWSTGHLSGGVPDSPVNYSGAPLRIPECVEFSLKSLGAPDTVRCARPGHTLVVFCSLCLNPFLVFLLVCCEPLVPVELIILEQTS